MDRRDETYINSFTTRSALGFDEMAEANRLAGGYWWEPDTLRFFRSRMVGGRADRGPDGRFYFVTSEKGPSGVRAYSIRAFDPKSASVDTVGTFQGYAHRSTALRVCARICNKALALAT